MKKIFQKIFPKKFGKFWKKVRNDKNFDKDLKFISDTFINSKSYNFVSNQWHLLNIISYQSILKNGLKNYGSEISTHFFTFIDFKNEYIKNLFDQIDKNQILSIRSDIFKKQNNFDYKNSVTYNYLCLLLYENLKKTDYYKYLKYLNDETFVGFNHPFITIDNIKISTDKIISLFDFEKINKFHNFNSTDKILEIGAGSGRLSECILSIENNINYTICDIPPSIYISYKRLKLAFPNKKIELLIDCSNKKELNDKIRKNEISFIFPHQLNEIDSNFFNLTVAVDCFHEMDKKTLIKYFEYIDISSQKIYFSIWEKTKNWYSGGIFKKTERLDFNKGDYPIPKNWNNIFKENLKFPSNHLGLGYKIIN